MKYLRLFIVLLIPCKTIIAQSFYEYDSKGQLISSKLSNCKATQYRYDNDGNRTVTQKSEILLSPTLVNSSCYGYNNGSIALNPNSNTYSYQWSNGNTSANISNLQPGSYTVTINDIKLNNQCIKTYIITQPPSINTSIITNSNQCFGGSKGSASIDTIALNNSNFSFHWSNNTTAKFITGLASGTYTVTVSNTVTNCNEVYTFGITSPPRSIQNTSAQNNVCYGDQKGYAAIALNGNPNNYTILWNDVGTGTSRNNLASGNYTVSTFELGTGCIDSANFSITSPPLLSVTDISSPSCINQSTGSISISVNGGVAPYKYTINGGSLGTNNTFQSLSSGTYTVIVRDKNLCYDTLVSIVQTKECNTGIKNLIENSISVYPSPSKGVFYIDISNIEPRSNYIITILDKEGKVVFDDFFDGPPNSKLQLRLLDVASGTYIVQLKTNKRLIGTSSIVIIK